MQLEIKELSKSYGRKLALDRVTMTLTEGVYGLLGPNGAGKSSFMNILAGNLSASSGCVLLDGCNVLKEKAVLRSRLGFMPQSQTLYSDFTPEQFLFYIASLKGMEKNKTPEAVDHVLNAVQLSSVRRRRIDCLSGGMRRRLLFGQAILNDPDILILDEPSAGLDPKQRISLRNLIGRLSLNKIVLISTHIVSDVESIAKEFLFLSHGRLLTQGTYSELIAPLADKVHEIRISEDRLYETESFVGVSAVTRASSSEYTVRMIGDVPPDVSCSSAVPNLEDLYLALFGEDENHEI